MRKLFVILIVVAAVILLAGTSITGLMIMDTDDPTDSGEKPYESGIVETGTKTVCADGDLVKVYDLDIDGVSRLWKFVEEKQGATEVKATFSSQVGYKCYKQ